MADVVLKRRCKLLSFFTIIRERNSNCGLQIRRIWIQLIIQSMRNIAREIVQNTHRWSVRNETATENVVSQTGSCRHHGSHSSVASSIGPDQWCLFCSLYTFSRNIPARCNQLDSTWENLENGINLGVTFSATSVVARALWAFQVSQGSMESMTLFRWGGKRLHDFTANLLRKLCA